MAKAIEGLKTKPDFVLADAVTIPHINVPQRGIIHGDARSISIGARKHNSQGGKGLYDECL